MSAFSQSYTGSSSIQGILLPTCAAIVSMLLLPLVLVQIRSRNVPLLALFESLSILNFFNFLNALVWREDNLGSWWNGNGLCDVEVKLYIGLEQAVVGAPACIFRHLSGVFVANQSRARDLASSRTFMVPFDLCLCVGLPIYRMSVHYVVQPDRYQIAVVAGCRYTYKPGWMSTVLLQTCGPLVCLITAGYSTFASYHLLRHRREVTSVLHQSCPDMSQARFVRLYIISALLMLIYIPLTVFSFTRNISQNLDQSFSWADTHPSNWSSLIVIVYELDHTILERWLQIVVGFICVLFFMGSEETTGQYRIWLRQVKQQMRSLQLAMQHAIARSAATSIADHPVQLDMRHHQGRDDSS